MALHIKALHQLGQLVHTERPRDASPLGEVLLVAPIASLMLLPELLYRRPQLQARFVSARIPVSSA